MWNWIPIYMGMTLRVRLLHLLCNMVRNDERARTAQTTLITLLTFFSLLITSCVSTSHWSDVPLTRPTYIYPEQTFTYRDVEVTYIEGGNPSGEAIIFLHGVLGDSHTWRLTMKALENDYRVLAIDLPGFGKSEKGEHLPLSISYYSEMVREFIQTKQLDKPTLVGVSISGHIILYHAINFPETISRAVINGSVGVDRRMRWSDHVLYGALWNDFFFKKVFLKPKKLRQIWQKQFECREEYKDDYETMPIFKNEVEYKQFISSFNNSISGIFFTTLKDTVKYIEVPLLIMWGGRDQHHSVADAYYIHSQVKGSQLAISPQCGHLLMLDDPEFFNEALRNFIQTGDPDVRQYTLEEVLGDSSKR